MKRKMTLSEIAETHRVAIRRDACGDPIIPGKNGHLYAEDGRPMICYTDDGRKRPLTTRTKGFAIKKLGSGLKRIEQEGDCEFIGEIEPAAVKTALFDVLMVKRRRILSEAQRLSLSKARAASPVGQPRARGAHHAAESFAAGRVVSDYHGGIEA